MYFMYLDEMITCLHSGLECFCQEIPFFKVG